MADKTIGTLPAAESLNDTSLLVAEQMGEAVSVSGALLKKYAAAAATTEAARAKEAADRAEAAVAHNPIVGENGNWFVWDAASGSYVDTGAAATGDEIFVTSFKGRTGAIVPQSGDYTAAMVGAAPSGYGGFGEATAAVTCSTEAEFETYLDNLLATINNFSSVRFSVHLPFIVGAYFFGVCYKRGAGESIVELASYVSPGALNRSCQLLKNKASGTWQPLEWFNPPMILGEEYRTTERYLGRPVFAQAVCCGKMANVGITNAKPVDAEGNEYTTSDQIDIVQLDAYMDTSGSAVGGYEVSLPYFEAAGSAPVAVACVEGVSVVFRTSANFSSYYGFAKIKYTKKTVT